MRSILPEYFRPTEQEFTRLWEEGVIVPDANVLLNLYRLSSGSAEELLSLLEQLRAQIWVPHQVTLEFLRNRIGVANDQHRVYKEVLAQLDKVREAIRAIPVRRHHPRLRTEDVRDRLMASVDEVETSVREGQQAHPSLPDDEEDPVLQRLGVLLEGRVGPPFSDDRLKEIYKQGEDRYKKQAPPGYMDAKEKPGDEKYGDLIVWFQTIEYAKNENKAIQFVSDDAKDDWWRRNSGKAWGPRPELVSEMRAKAGVSFWMYSTDRFIHQASSFLKRKVSPQTLAESRAVREETAATAEAQRVARARNVIVHQATLQRALEWLEASNRMTRYADSAARTAEVVERLKAAAGPKWPDHLVPRLTEIVAANLVASELVLPDEVASASAVLDSLTDEQRALVAAAADTAIKPAEDDE